MTKTLTLTAALLLAAGLLRAQPAAPTTPNVYDGPRFPGGPDSLRALVLRSIRQTTSNITGLLVVKFELKDGRTPQNFELPAQPPPVNPAPLAAAVPALSYLQAKMPDWLPALPNPNGKRNDKPGENPKVYLALPFGATAPAYYFPDVMPEFPGLSKLVPSQIRRNFVRWTDEKKVGLGQKLSTFLQVQMRYPTQAQRNDEQGTVVAYFEVSETGAVENRQIVGTASPSLDAEVLRILQLLPAAAKPAQVAGRPVRLYFAAPCTFKIQ